MSVEWVGVCSTLTAGAYALYMYLNHNSRQLTEAKRITNLQDLHHLPNHSYVAVEGTVASTRALQPRHNSSYWCVLYDLEERQHISKWISFPTGGGEWVDTIGSTRVSRNETPFHITDASKIQVIIENARQGITSGLLQEVTDHLEPHPRTAFTDLWDSARGEQRLGTQYIENILPIDTHITCVGELSKFPQLTIHPPSTSHPYLISRLRYPQLVASHQSRSKWAWRVVCFMGAVTCVISSLYAYRLYKRYTRHRELEKNRRDAVARWEQQHRDGQVNYDAEIDTSQPTGLEDVCVICLSAPRQLCYTACGHICTCIACHKRGNISKCPLCREPVDPHRGAVRAYK